jgi:hypothetical protein
LRRVVFLAIREQWRVVESSREYSGEQWRTVESSGEQWRALESS